MKYYLIGILIFASSNPCFSGAREDLKGATIRAESSTVNLREGTVRHERAVIVTKDGKIYKANYLEQSWQENELIELMSYGSPITYVDSEAKGNELSEGRAESLSYKSKDNTIVLKEYSIKDAEGNTLIGEIGKYIVEE